MKVLISEKQYKVFLKEQKYVMPQPSSDYLGRGGGFERNLYQGNKENYIEIYKKIPAEKIKQVRLIFPKKSWEQKALEYLKKFGIITGIYTSVKSAINFVSNLVERGVKTDELVIGSHGMEGKILFTKEEGSSEFVDDFLNSIKNLIHSGTKVFFTACNSADYLDTLKNAAEKLGVGVYGSAGIYNYVLNSSEKGFYYCSPNKFEAPKTNVKINPIYESINGWVQVYLYQNPENYKFKVKIKDNVFGRKIPELQGMTEKYERQGYSQDVAVLKSSEVRKPVILNLYTIDFKDVIEKYAKSIEKNNRNFFHEKNSELYQKENRSIGRYLEEKLKSREIIIEINGVDIFQMKPYIKPAEIDNEFLLKNKLCKKVSGSPISWI